MIQQKKIGEWKGVDIISYTLQNSKGLKIECLNFGAVLRSCFLPENPSLDIVLGFDSWEEYASSLDLDNPPYFGAVLGRFAGRIAHGRFSLHGKEIQLAQNHGEHHIHGGKNSLCRSIWKAKTEGNTLIFEHTCPSGHEGYPGELKVEMSYSLSDENELINSIRAFSTEDTIVNLTQHHYWNLEGDYSTVKDHSVFLNSKRFLMTDLAKIPTGEMVEWSNKPLQEPLPKKLLDGIDHTFVLEKSHGVQALLKNHSKDWEMSVRSNQAACHIFIGCELPSHFKGKNGHTYHAKSGICFEMQNFPDAPNHPHFPSSYLEKDKIYQNDTIFHFEKRTHV